MKWFTVLATGLVVSQASAQAADDEASLMKRLTQQFEHSDIEFQRAASNIPFLPVAFLGASYYGDADVDTKRRGVKDPRYNVTAISQAAGLPFLLTQRDALVVGEYVSIADIDIEAVLRPPCQAGRVKINCHLVAFDRDVFTKRDINQRPIIHAISTAHCPAKAMPSKLLAVTTQLSARSVPTFMRRNNTPLLKLESP